MLDKLFGKNAEQKAFAGTWNSVYPFLRIKNNGVCPWTTEDDCWLEEIPAGWISAFGEQMCNELLETLNGYIDDFIILQMKEKFGELRVYWCFDDEVFNKEDADKISEIREKINDIFSKYSALSAHTCVECGKEANYSSTGWVLPYCAECKPEGAIAIRSK